MNWFNWLPFRHRYWLIRKPYTGLRVVRARLATFATDGGCWDIADGPFDYQEDAARALQFWQHQAEKQYR